jgi:phage terminase large subunit GpA-like protein
VIDSGHLHSRVYEWATKYPADRVRVVKGVMTGNTYGTRGSEIEIGHQIKAKTGHHIWLASKNLLLGQVYAWLKENPPTAEKLEAGEGYPTGYIHTPKTMPEEFYRQLTADMLIDGKWHDKKAFHRNEALDIRCYCDMEAYLSWVHRYDAAGVSLPLKAHVVEESGAVSQQPTVQQRAALRPRGFRVYGRRS